MSSHAAKSSGNVGKEAEEEKDPCLTPTGAPVSPSSGDEKIVEDSQDRKSSSIAALRMKAKEYEQKMHFSYVH